jgi:hypothetical protein
MVQASSRKELEDVLLMVLGRHRATGYSLTDDTLSLLVEPGLTDANQWFRVPMGAQRLSDWIWTWLSAWFKTHVPLFNDLIKGYIVCVPPRAERKVGLVCTIKPVFAEVEG